jgi:hypothetical protein
MHSPEDAMKLAKAIFSRFGFAKGDEMDAVDLRFAQLSMPMPRPRLRRRCVSPFAVIVRPA